MNRLIIVRCCTGSIASLWCVVVGGYILVFTTWSLKMCCIVVISVAHRNLAVGVEMVLALSFERGICNRFGSIFQIFNYL